MTVRRPRPAPAVGDPGDPAAWARFLGERVEAGLAAFLEGLRHDGLNLAQALEGEASRWKACLAIALLEARRCGLERDRVLDLYGRIQERPPDRLERDLGIPPPVIEEAAVLVTRGEELARRAGEAGVADLLERLRLEEETAASLGRSRLREVSREEEHFRALVRDAPVPFRAQAFYDRGDGVSRVLLSLCLIRGFRLPEEAVPFVPRKAPGEGRSMTREVGLGGAFLRALPPSGERAGDLLVLHAGPLARVARRRAYEAAARAIGLGHLPGRGEILVRLLAAAGEKTSRAALAAEEEHGRTREDEALRTGFGERRRRHGPVLRARVKAVEAECRRLLEKEEPVFGGEGAFLSMELSLWKAGQRLGRAWNGGGAAGGTRIWRIDPGPGEEGPSLPPPPRG